MERMLDGLGTLASQVKQNNESGEYRLATLAGQIRQSNESGEQRMNSLVRQINDNVARRLDDLATSSAQEWTSLNRQLEELAHRQFDMDEVLSTLVGRPTVLTTGPISRLRDAEVRVEVAQAKDPIRSRTGPEAAPIAAAPSLVATTSGKKDKGISDQTGPVGLESVRRSARLLAKGSQPVRSTSVSFPLHVTWTSGSGRLAGGEDNAVEVLPQLLSELATPGGRLPTIDPTRGYDGHLRYNAHTNVDIYNFDQASPV
jgi:hypothetical protein